MRYLGLLTVALICLIIIAGADPAPQNQNFNTKAILSVDNTTMTLSSAVAITEARNYPAGYSWVRIHFYAFPLTSDDIAAARTGNVQSLDSKANKNSFDPKTHTSAHGTIQLSVDKDFKVWQVDMSIPGHGCTIAPFEKDVQSFLQTYHYDGKNLRLKSKGSFICDLKSVGAGEKTYKWDIDVTLPVFEKPTPKNRTVSSGHFRFSCRPTARLQPPAGAPSSLFETAFLEFSASLPGNCPATEARRGSFSMRYFRCFSSSSITLSRSG